MRVMWIVLIVVTSVGCSRQDNEGAPPASGLAAAGTPDSAGSAPLPEPVSPFPTGFSGQLVFQSDREGRTKIYTLDLATGRLVRLTSDQQYRDENPRWSPDGTRIVFKSNRAHYGAHAEPGDPDFDLYVMNANGGDLRRVTSDPANEGDPSWAADAQSIFFTSDRGSRGDLFRVWLRDDRIDQLTRHFVGRAIMPTASPEGQRVAFAAQTLNLGSFWAFQVHLLDLATLKTKALGGSGGSCWPAWAPDGRRLAYVLLDEEPSGLEMIDLQTGQRARLVQDAKLWSYYPDWSSDGAQVAFSVSPHHHAGEDWDLAVMRVAQPGRFIRLTTGAGNDRLPDWRPVARRP